MGGIEAKWNKEAYHQNDNKFNINRAMTKNKQQRVAEKVMFQRDENRELQKESKE